MTFAKTYKSVTGLYVVFSVIIQHFAQIVGSKTWFGNLVWYGQVIVYLDDLTVFGKSMEEHEQRFLSMIDQLEEDGLKLSIDKYQFCQSQVIYVGFVMESGVATDSAKVEAVAH